MRVRPSFGITLVLLGCSLLLVACGRSTDQQTSSVSGPAITGSVAKAPPQQPQANRGKRPSRATNAVAPQWLPSSADKRHATAAQTFPGFATVGVPACDSLAKLVVQCLDTHGVGKPQTTGLHDAFAGKVVGWRKLLAGGTSAAVVAEQCAQYKSEKTGSYRALGCSEL